VCDRLAAPLAADIQDWADMWNADPKPLVCHKSAEQVLERRAGYRNVITNGQTIMKGHQPDSTRGLPGVYGSTRGRRRRRLRADGHAGCTARQLIVYVPVGAVGARANDPCSHAAWSTGRSFGAMRAMSPKKPPGPARRPKKSGGGGNKKGLRRKSGGKKRQLPKKKKK
jgi:hypothetical protein